MRFLAKFFTRVAKNTSTCCFGFFFEPEVPKSLREEQQAKRIIDALKMVIEYDTDTMYDIYAQQEAIYLLSLINKGKILLPEFN